MRKSTSASADTNRIRVFAALLALCMLAVSTITACDSAPGTHEGDNMIDARGEEFITNAEELAAFFEAGAKSAILMADIDMGADMLKLSKGRGSITLYGNGNTIMSAAACAIRLDDGCSITLDKTTVLADQTAIGLLGDGEISGQALSLSAHINAIHAAGGVRIGEDSDITLTSEAGMGIRALSVHLGNNSKADIIASTYAIRAGRGGVSLGDYARASLTASGDNCIYSEGDLVLSEDAVFIARNSGDHNAALVAELFAHDTATLEATGGANGMGLFITEQHEDVTLKGFSKPEVRLESGSGRVVFN